LKGCAELFARARAYTDRHERLRPSPNHFFRVGG
jgi:hypothetical protein